MGIKDVMNLQREMTDRLLGAGTKKSNVSFYTIKASNLRKPIQEISGADANVVVKEYNFDVCEHTDLWGGLWYEQRVYEYVHHKLYLNRITRNLCLLVGVSANKQQQRSGILPAQVYKYLGLGSSEFTAVTITLETSFNLQQHWSELEIEDRVQILFQILFTITAMVENGIYHNDLHAQNVLLDTPIPFGMESDEAVYDTGKFRVNITCPFVPRIFDFDFASCNKGIGNNLFDWTSTIIQNVLQPTKNLCSAITPVSLCLRPWNVKWMEKFIQSLPPSPKYIANILNSFILNIILLPMRHGREFFMQRLQEVFWIDLLENSKNTWHVLSRKMLL